MSDIRKEFEKAFYEKYPLDGREHNPGRVALWAAKWMAERCAKEAPMVTRCVNKCACHHEVADRIHQLAKDLDS